MSRSTALLALCALCCSSACSDAEPRRRADAGGGSDAGGLDGGSDAGDPPEDAGEDAARTPGSYLTELASPEDYAAVQGEGAEVKYLANAGRESPEAPLDAPCIFQDTQAFDFHVQFLRTFPAYANLDYDSYLALVLRRATRVWWGGGLKLFPATTHPISEASGVISFTAYQEGGGDENLTLDEIAGLYTRLRGCAPYAKDLLVFVPDGAEQVAHVRAMRAELTQRGVPVLMPEELLTGLGAQIYSEGESYGYLRIVPRAEPLDEHGPRDVLVVQSAPGDLAIAAGLITEFPQSEHSHVNLRLREKGTPNAALPSVYDNALIASLAGTLVHVVAEGDTLVVEPARLADAEAFWKARQPMLEAPTADLTVSALRPFADLRAEDRTAYGTKAANLGELHALLPEVHRNVGFGIPFAAYHAFASAPALAEQISELLSDPLVKTDAVVRGQRLKALRDALKVAALPDGFAAALEQVMVQVWGEAGRTLRLKFRSSTNAEDLDVLSGAGLYDSKSGCLADDLDPDTAGPSLCLTEADAAAYQALLEAHQAELAAHPERSWLQASIEDLTQELHEEKSALGAIRKVWASLWTERAFEERAYYGIPHDKVYMGIAVNPSFTREELDAVAVTNLPSAAGGPLYRIVTQVAEIGVVDPLDPSATPETLVFQRGAGDVVEGQQLLVASSRSDGETLWPADRLATLQELLFLIQDHFEANVYPALDPLALDLEIKLDHAGNVVIKQVRPYRVSTP